MTQPMVLIADFGFPDATALMNSLRMHDYRPLAAKMGETVLQMIVNPDVAGAIIWASEGPCSGLDVIRDIRNLGVTKPLLSMSPTVDSSQWIRCIEAGASDHILHPCSPEELVARLSVSLWRVRNDTPTETILDRATQTVQRSGRAIELTAREFALLEMLHAHAGEVLSRGKIFDALWANEGTSSENVVDVYVGYLRRKFSEFSEVSLDIKTIRNKGFVLETQRQC